ncbi:MAG: rhomboid family intramembrane serine protease [Kiritimatiellae bacterium]|nr:rhomboid family intramembrane serine protease [Kiritimatiellia bacterium]NLD88833.1 rhomboid family intramembrane serine protease [Lentisphaerota bacterium]HQQ60568.1 rhomboid family intramembrane serine protease [Kiritimatiellia bacterium]
MRMIGQLPTEEQARLFADYLFVRDIEAQVETVKGGGWAVWVVDEERVDEGQALLSRFRSMPDAEEFHQAAAVALERRRDERQEAREEQQRLRRPGALAWHLGGGGLTMLLSILCIVVGLATRLGENTAWTEWLLISNLPRLDPLRFWNSLGEVSSGQVWRLFTPVLLHFSLWHLLFNLLWMQDLGTALEARIGTWRFAGLVVLVAVASNLAQYVAGGAGFGGMSGVVYGLFGYLWVRSRQDFHFGLYVSSMTSSLLLVFLALGIFGLLGPTANAAHFSGLVVGGVLGWIAGKPQGI